MLDYCFKASARSITSVKMWSSLHYFGTILWSVSIFTAMLQDAPKEVTELFDIALPNWYMTEADPSSCLKSQLGANYANTLGALRSRLIDFYGTNRSSGDASVVFEMTLTLEEIAARRGFLLETHNVTTDDGWQISLHRVRNTQYPPGTPVLIPSMFLSSSAFWLLGDRNTSLAYIIADGGFDVWLGNYRGNSLYSTKHNLSQQDWEFTVNDHALYDIPAQIDYVLRMTSHIRLHLAGVSQGAIASFQEAQEFLPVNNLLSGLVVGAEKQALVLVQELIGLTTDYIDSHKLPLVIKYLPAGTSSLVLHSYYELWRSETNTSHSVSTFDYGSEGNLKRFGTASPLMMRASFVTAPTKLYFSEGDAYSPPEENLQMIRDLPSVVGHLFIRDKKFSHYNFAWNDRNSDVFIDVRDFFTKYNASY